MAKNLYHILNPSPWPIFMSIFLPILLYGVVGFIYDWHFWLLVLCVGLVGCGLISFMWFFDILKEAIKDNAHNVVVQKGLRIGMVVFIASELILFCVFFVSFFKSWLNPVFIDGEMLQKGLWPPKGLKVIDPWSIPFLNTLILLLSSTSVTWAHHAVINQNRSDLIKALSATIGLGFLFVFIQAFEYMHAGFSLKDESYSSIYVSNFFLLTGFHGAHVVIGIIFLLVGLFRAIKGHFTSTNYLGLEFAAWYWHFVDVVWLFLFIFLYWLSS